MELYPRLTSITQGSAVVTLEYDDAGRRTRLTLPTGVTTEYGYDAASRLTSLTYKHGANTLGALTYTYDAAGRRTSIGGTWARTLLPDALTSATYNAANHQVMFGGQALTYDLNGNLTDDGTNTYAWTARDQLASITGPTAASFVYDALGRRQRTTIGATITDLVYDGLTPVREATGATIVDLLTGLGIDEYLIRTTGSTTEHYLADALGSTVALADGAGAAATEYSYEPFGAVDTTGTASGNEKRYTGREDDGTGLNYYRARYYHPGLQRFISEDPIGFAGGDVNLYAYVAGNPLKFVDPLGLEKTRNRHPCPAVPLAPPGARIDENIAIAELMWAGPLGLELVWFASMVAPGGPWDYKLRAPDRRYEDFGNFHYGATGAAGFLPEDTLLQAAGTVQWARSVAGHAYDPLWRRPWEGPPYGDDPADQSTIKAGIEYYKCKR